MLWRRGEVAGKGTFLVCGQVEYAKYSFGASPAFSRARMTISQWESMAADSIAVTSLPHLDKFHPALLQVEDDRPDPDGVADLRWSLADPTHQQPHRAIDIDSNLISR